MLDLFEEIDGLVQDCSKSSALALELLQSCTKLSKYKRTAWNIMTSATEWLKQHNQQQQHRTK